MIVHAFMGGGLALLGAVAETGFADGVGDAVARAWPYVLTALVLWAIAAAASAVALVALGAAVGVLQVAGVTDGFLGVVAVFATWARLSARPVGRLLHPTANGR